MEEVVDEAGLSELEGGSEEDKVEVVGEDFEVSGERRLLLFLRILKEIMSAYLMRNTT